ncbi:HD-GYP domain-containing protein [Reinekea marinisedimentorum]|uniref:Putative nucleotidyltransferase with HDIG domain n=1 Tax=Reinekea marinisedimentorum TaxID=230495 RepID=A0A4R3I8T9_9GAMM|nr:HD-GYP domain-containing protein [Reinekea marinisedimentorum]TCS41426.1 putative nucleotidyltransferase with HDIG domain [Reinekea marinisedimentorum]
MMKGKTYQDIEVPVSKLEIGMHVVKLDRPWEETPFLLQSFIIRTLEELHQLQYQCNYVYVQVRIEQLEELQSRIGKAEPQKTAATALLRGPQSKTRVKYLNRVSFDEAIESSYMTFTSARALATSVMDGLRVGNTLNINECRNVVEKIVDQVLDNKDTLKYLTLLKNKDAYTAEHSMNVCILCATFARHLGLMEFEIKIIAMCGLLHDVGKSKVPEEILNKPGRLTKEEAHIMAEHSTYGRNILMALKGESRYAVDVAHSHHERVDGRGYPRSLTSAQIPYYAKIVTIVDAYDAMTSDRCYTRGKSSFQALRVIFENAGSQFDTQLAKEFIQCIGFYNTGSLVQLESGQIAIVAKSNEDKPLRPKLAVITDEHQKLRSKEMLIDLTNEKYRHYHIEKELPNGTAGIDVKSHIEKMLKKRREEKQ